MKESERLGRERAPAVRVGAPAAPAACTNDLLSCRRVGAPEVRRPKRPYSSRHTAGASQLHAVCRSLSAAAISGRQMANLLPFGRRCSRRLPLLTDDVISPAAPRTPRISPHLPAPPRTCDASPVACCLLLGPSSRQSADG